MIPIITKYWFTLTSSFPLRFMEGLHKEPPSQFKSHLTCHSFKFYFFFLSQLCPYLSIFLLHPTSCINISLNSLFLIYSPNFPFGKPISQTPIRLVLKLHGNSCFKLLSIQYYYLYRFGLF